MAEFEQFGVQHLCAVLVIALATTVLALLLRRVNGRPAEPRVRRGVCWSLAAVLLVAFLFEMAFEISQGWWRLEESLPLHLCDLAVFVCVFALYCAGRASHRTQTGRFGQIAYELAYFWGLGGTIQALLTPELAVAFPHPLYFTFFVNHGTIVASVLIMTLGLSMRPWPGALLRTWLLTLLVAIPVGVFDWLAGANYMYLAGPPKNPSLLDSFAAMPWYLLELGLVGTVIFMLFYSPFWIKDRVARRRRRGARV